MIQHFGRQPIGKLTSGSTIKSGSIYKNSASSMVVFPGAAPSQAGFYRSGGSLETGRARAGEIAQRLNRTQIHFVLTVDNGGSVGVLSTAKPEELDAAIDEAGLRGANKAESPFRWQDSPCNGGTY